MSVAPKKPCRLQNSAYARKVAAVDDLLDKSCHGRMGGSLRLFGRGIGVGCGGIDEDTQNFDLGKDLAVMQREQERFTNGQSGLSGDVRGAWHFLFNFPQKGAMLQDRSRCARYRVTLADNLAVTLICISVLRRKC